MKIFGRAVASLLALFFVVMAVMLPVSQAHAQTITSFTPGSGPSTGGTTVVITGSGFTNATSVTFGGIPATSFTVDSPTQITAVTPFYGIGFAPIQVFTPTGSTTSATSFQFLQAPQVYFLNPLSGSTAGGTTVIINGADFTGATAVMFGTVPATSFTVLSPSQISAVTPPNSAGNVSVFVTTPGGTNPSGSTFQYIAPGISFVSTAQGSTAGGSVVSLNGFGFTGATGVSYGGVPALAFSVINDGTIRTVTPPGTAGAVDIEVAIAGGPYVRSNGFTYVSPQSPAITRFSPTIGSTAGGTSVVITGQNFTGATGVTFAGVAATSFTVDSATQITAITPAGTNGTAAIAVTTPIGTASSGSSSFFYQAPPVSAPSITNVTPSSGSSAGGSTVTILGTNLVGSTSVTFGGTPATSFSLVSPNSLSAIAPAGTVGTVDVVVTTPLGSATRANAFTYTATAAPQITSFTPNNGPITGGTTVTITGAGFTGATAVRFIGVTASSFTVDSDTQITAVTAAPPGFASSTVQVVTPNGTAISSRLFTYTASSISPPAVVSLSPASGLPAGGNSVTITGTNFSGANEVRFGNTLASSYVVDSPTQITAIAPAGSVGAVAVSVTTLGGSVSSSNAYTYASSQQQLTSQTISFTSTAPGSAVVGGATYTPTATATSGLPLPSQSTAAARPFAPFQAASSASLAQEPVPLTLTRRATLASQPRHACSKAFRSAPLRRQLAQFRQIAVQLQAARALSSRVRT